MSFCRAFFHIAGNGLFWLCLLGVIVGALLPRFVVKVVNQHYTPSDIQIAREAEKFGNFSALGNAEVEMNRISYSSES